MKLNTPYSDYDPENEEMKAEPGDRYCLTPLEASLISLQRCAQVIEEGKIGPAMSTDANMKQAKEEYKKWHPEEEEADCDVTTNYIPTSGGGVMPITICD